MSKLFCLIIMLLFLCGCSRQQADSTTIPTTSATASPIIETTIHQCIQSTTAPTVQETTPALCIEAGTYLERFTDLSGDYLDYYMYIPENATEDMPLIIFLHGNGQIGRLDKLIDYGMLEKMQEYYGNQYPFIVIAPCVRTTWIADPVPTTLKNLIDDVVSKCKIDSRKIVITGHSSGAIGLWNMVSTHGDYFSAAVPVSCGARTSLSYPELSKVPIWAFVGTIGYEENNYLLAMTDIINTLQYSGANARLTVLDGCRHEQTSTMPYTKSLFQWMISQ